MIPLTLLLYFVKIVLAILKPMLFHIEFRMIFLFLQKALVEPEYSKQYSNKERKIGKITLPSLKTYYKTTESRQWYWQKGRHIGQWSRIKSRIVTVLYIYD